MKKVPSVYAPASTERTELRPRLMRLSCHFGSIYAMGDPGSWMDCSGKWTSRWRLSLAKSSNGTSGTTSLPREPDLSAIGLIRVGRFVSFLVPCQWLTPMFSSRHHREVTIFSTSSSCRMPFIPVLSSR